MSAALVPPPGVRRPQLLDVPAAWSWVEILLKAAPEPPGRVGKMPEILNRTRIRVAKRRELPV